MVCVLTWPIPAADVAFLYASLTPSAAPQAAMMTENWKEAKALLDEALQLLPEEPLIISL
jgi:hypothetical protein